MPTKRNPFVSVGRSARQSALALTLTGLGIGSTPAAANPVDRYVYAEVSVGELVAVSDSPVRIIKRHAQTGMNLATYNVDLDALEAGVNIGPDKNVEITVEFEHTAQFCVDGPNGALVMQSDASRTVFVPPQPNFPIVDAFGPDQVVVPGAAGQIPTADPACDIWVIGNPIWVIGNPIWVIGNPIHDIRIVIE